MRIKNNQLYLGGRKATELAEKYGTPLYVYEADLIKKRYKDLVKNIKYDKLKIHYACKANSNIEIIKLLKKQGCNIETKSKGEVLLALKAGYKPNQIIYNCPNIEKEELEFLIKNKIVINLDSFFQIESYGKLNPNGKISVRLNQGIGGGHHKHVITGEPESKFGIYFTEVNKIKKVAKKYNLRIIGFHQHIGSGILDKNIFLGAIKALLKTAEKFEDLEFINFGGGLGVSYKPDEQPLCLKKLGKKITKLFNDFNKRYGKKLTMIFEPGRYLVSEAGILLVKVTDIKRTPFKTFVGVNSGFDHLIRPVLYGAYHEVLNANKVKGVKEIVSIAGNLCESGDLFAKERKITKSKIGDILAILNAGAYGFSMSSNYSLRPKPAEISVDKGKVKIIRKRQKIESLLREQFS